VKKCEFMIYVPAMRFPDSSESQVLAPQIGSESARSQERSSSIFLNATEVALR